MIHRWFAVEFSPLGLVRVFVSAAGAVINWWIVIEMMSPRSMLRRVPRWRPVHFVGVGGSSYYSSTGQPTAFLQRWNNCSFGTVVVNIPDLALRLPGQARWTTSITGADQQMVLAIQRYDYWLPLFEFRITGRPRPLMNINHSDLSKSRIKPFSAGYWRLYRSSGRAASSCASGYKNIWRGTIYLAFFGAMGC